MKKLFNDDDSADEETPILRTNKEYERVYNSFREKELKQKREDGYGLIYTLTVNSHGSCMVLCSQGQGTKCPTFR